MQQWGHLINDEGVYTGPPFEYPPENFPQDVYYKVKGHPYWVIDYSNDISTMEQGIDIGRVRGTSTYETDLNKAKYSEPYRDAERIEMDRPKKGKYKNVDKYGPFRSLFEKAGKSRLPGALGVITTGLLAPWDEIRADPLRKGAEYGIGAATGVDVPKFQKDYSDTLKRVTGQTFGEKWGESGDWWRKKLDNIWNFRP